MRERRAVLGQEANDPVSHQLVVDSTASSMCLERVKVFMQPARVSFPCALRPAARRTERQKATRSVSMRQECGSGKSVIAESGFGLVHLGSPASRYTLRFLFRSEGQCNFPCSSVQGFL